MKSNSNLALELIVAISAAPHHMTLVDESAVFAAKPLPI